jgi:hypothetical protein
MRLSLDIIEQRIKKLAERFAVIVLVLDGLEKA